MDRYSAYIGIVVAVICIGVELAQFVRGPFYDFPIWDWLSWLLMSPPNALRLIVAILFFESAWRVLRRKSGGLRLLAGCFGLSIGATLPYAWSFLFSVVSGTEGNLTAVQWTAVSAVGVAAALSIAGLAMTVLHKEQKKPAPAN